MAFESLTQKLQNVFKNLRGKGRLSEGDVKAALKEVRMALLEADVSFKVVKQFIAAIEARAVGTDVLESLTPGQQVIKIVHEEMISLMGSERKELTLKPPGERSIVMMAGLQGAGKTTTAAKLAGKWKAKGYSPLLVACDIYRPAAIEQLSINAKKQDIAFFSMGTEPPPLVIARESLEEARRGRHDLIILDTAGRLHVDEGMMEELAQIKEAIPLDATLLVVDAMTGQDAVNVATLFEQKLGIDGIVLTKLDGDTRGGAALSIKAVTGKPILYAGMGEKLSDLEQFFPDRMAGRILGMGDILTLIEKAEFNMDEEKAREMTRKLKKAEFDFNDFLEQMQQMKKMGGLAGILQMMPGLGGGIPSGAQLDDSQMSRVEAIILSMTAKERGDPSLLNPSRKNRIARGAGVDISEVNRLIKRFEEMRRMMKQFAGMGGKKRGGLGSLFGGMKFPGGM